MKIGKSKKDLFLLMMHTDKNLAWLIYKELLEYEISNKIFTLTLDNPSNNNVAI